ncbi:hypothetical protein [Ferroglobus placidus]|uniref:hypothetical protein n=1 Tax=Ferroglobus placidus TaxID=54261 RepID=UPI0011D08C8F|nr:hypothetical protein [Ferroglobus placidus]
MENKETVGYVCGKQIVVPECPFCGRPHFHGHTGEKIGEVAGRVSHCMEGHYLIRIEDKECLSEKEIVKRALGKKNGLR